MVFWYFEVVISTSLRLKNLEIIVALEWELFNLRIGLKNKINSLLDKFRIEFLEL